MSAYGSFGWFLIIFEKNGWILNLEYQKWCASGLKFIRYGTYNFHLEITTYNSKYLNLSVFGCFWLFFCKNGWILKLAKTARFWYFEFYFVISERKSYVPHRMKFKPSAYHFWYPRFRIQLFFAKISQKQPDFDIYNFILLFHKESRMFRI